MKNSERMPAPFEKTHELSQVAAGRNQGLGGTAFDLSAAGEILDQRGKRDFHALLLSQEIRFPTHCILPVGARPLSGRQ